MGVTLSFTTGIQSVKAFLLIKYEQYSVELLKAVVDLWVNIRGHSFARDFMMNFEAKFTKGTRKTLIPK